MSGLVTTTAAQGTLRALADDASNSSIENDAYGAVGSSIDFLAGDEGVAYAEDTETDPSGDQLFSGLFETDDGGQGVYTRDGEVVGAGPTPDEGSGSGGGDSDDESDDSSGQQTLQRIILAPGSDGGGMLSSPLVLVALAALGYLAIRES